jgi:hypothetical protein
MIQARPSLSRTHLNYTARGTTAFDGTVAPTRKFRHTAPPS